MQKTSLHHRDRRFLHSRLRPSSPPRFLESYIRSGGLPVSHVQVRVEGAGAALTSDSGEFALPMTANLHVGMAAVFHVKDWVILKPCELKSGRAYLRDPSAEPMELLVLARGDPRLTSAKRDVSIIGCLLEESFSSSPRSPSPLEGLAALCRGIWILCSQMRLRRFTPKRARSLHQVQRATIFCWPHIVLPLRRALLRSPPRSPPMQRMQPGTSSWPQKPRSWGYRSWN